jgi:hypothetical protein
MGKAGSSEQRNSECSKRIHLVFGTKLACRMKLIGRQQDCIEKRQLIPVEEFLAAKTSIYSRSWLPSPWQVVAWGLRQLGLVNEKTGEGTKVGRFIVMDNVEVSKFIPFSSQMLNTV